MVWPTAEYVVGVGVFTSDTVLVWTAVTVACAWLESVPATCAVAWLVTDPAFRSACVIVYVAVHVIDSVGSSFFLLLPPPPTSALFPFASLFGSVTGPASKTLPVFVTR